MSKLTRSKDLTNEEDFDKIIQEFKALNEYESKIIKTNLTFNKYIDSIFNDTLLNESIQHFFNNNTLLKKYNIDKNSLKIKYSYTMDYFGCCTTINTLIFSKPLLMNLSKYEVFMIVAHEFAHLLRNNFLLINDIPRKEDDHGKEWFEIYKEISNKSTKQINKIEKKIDISTENFNIDHIKKYEYNCTQNSKTYSNKLQEKCSCGCSWENIIERYSCNPRSYWFVN